MGNPEAISASSSPSAKTQLNFKMICMGQGEARRYLKGCASSRNLHAALLYREGERQGNEGNVSVGGSPRGPAAAAAAAAACIYN